MRCLSFATAIPEVVPILAALVEAAAATPALSPMLRHLQRTLREARAAAWQLPGGAAAVRAGRGDGGGTA
jgi:hypothetical protein